jgi:cytochrome bd-type quinol oxidase subunit 1
VVGVITKDSRYDRLAHEFTRLLALAFTVTAVLGCLLFLGLYFLYPQFYLFMTGIFKSTYYVYVTLLVGEVVYAYLYYYSWNVLSGSAFNKTLHILIGVLLNLFGTLIMFMADAWASFMMSPEGIYETGHLQNLWRAVNNFTWMPLNIHRLLANVAFGGFVAGAYAAVKYLTCKTPEEKAHYDWMGYTGNFIGALAMIPLPFAGYWLAREVYAFNQTMGVTMMGGIFSWLFIVQAVLIGVIFISINYYFWIGMSRVQGGERFAKHQIWMLALIVIGVAVWMTPHNLPMTSRELAKIGGVFHPLVGVLGVMSAKNTAVNLIILTTFISFLLYRRVDKIHMVGWGMTGKIFQSLLLGGAAAVVVFYGVKGYFVPANVRIGYSVYQVMAVLTAMLSVTAIDIFLFRHAKSTGEVRWGQMPARSQYALITLAVTTVFLMGLMGYLRSGLRESWHIYGILRDSSLGAYTPKLGVACSVIGVITLIFFALVVMIFWLGERTKQSTGSDQPSVKPGGRSAYADS